MLPFRLPDNAAEQLAEAERQMCKPEHLPEVLALLRLGLKPIGESSAATFQTELRGIEGRN